MNLALILKAMTVCILATKGKTIFELFGRVNYLFVAYLDVSF